MSTVLHATLTASDFWRLPETDARRELIRGEVVETMPPGARHGAIAVSVPMLLWLWARRTGGGYVGVEAGYVLARNPDTVRGPNVSYVQAKRIPPGGVPEGFRSLPPDLAVEVVSPTETAEDVRQKVRDFLDAGTSMAWTLYPRARELLVHTPDGLTRTYGAQDELLFPELLPGFSCTVAELYA